MTKLKLLNNAKRCGLPLCGKDCETEGYHPLECQVFSESAYKFSVSDLTNNFLYEPILPLRCLLLQQRNSMKWNTLTALESHDHLRRGSELWNREQVNYEIV